jgi:hypothetical protein
MVTPIRGPRPHAETPGSLADAHWLPLLLVAVSTAVVDVRTPIQTLHRDLTTDINHEMQ